MSVRRKMNFTSAQGANKLSSSLEQTNTRRKAVRFLRQAQFVVHYVKLTANLLVNWDF